MSGDELQSPIKKFGSGFASAWSNLMQVGVFCTLATAVLAIAFGWVMVIPIMVGQELVPAEQRGLRLVVTLVCFFGWNLFITYPIGSGIGKVIDDE